MAFVVGVPVPTDDDQRRLLQMTWDVFSGDAKWPTFAEIDRKLYRVFDLDARQVAQSLPAELLYPPMNLPLPGDQQMRLTIAGAAACQGSEEDQRYFLQIIRYAAEVEKSWTGPPVEETEDAVLTAASVRRDVTLPAAGRDSLLARLGQLLAVEPWGWQVASPDSPDWQFTMSRGVRPFRGVADLSHYWAIRTQDIALTTPLGHNINGRATMPTADKLFISHASSDRRLADLLRDTLVLGGIPEERIFYSSARASGIPSGQEVQSYLRTELQDAGLVIELISVTFLARPMCLIELGGAWALEKPTYPVVVPPLERGEATQQVGNVHMGLLGTDAEVDDVFDELHGRLADELDLSTKTTSWNRAVRHFKLHLPVELAAIDSTRVVHAAKFTAPASAKPSSNEPGSMVAIGNYSATAAGHEVYGEATNNDTIEHTASLKATFYDAEHKIVGTADGLVSQIAPGDTKTFALTSLDGIPKHSLLKVQVDTVF